MGKAKSILYLTYDGVLEPLGESQVVAYLEQLSAKMGHGILLISYEKEIDWMDLARRQAMKERLEKAGIRWFALRYHKSPTIPATLFDLFVGLALCSALFVRHRFKIVHARSYIMAIIALFSKQVFRTKFLFDMRGFWPDERADSGQWSRSSGIYRVMKRLEELFLKEADLVVSLTDKAVKEMEQRNYLKGLNKSYRVIPTCADTDKFTPSNLSGLPSATFTLGYVGSLGLWYDFAPVIKAFRALREIRPDSRLLILSKQDTGMIQKYLKDLPTDSWEMRSCHLAEVPEQMKRMQAGIFFIRPFYSKMASAPTKLAEFLSAGVPCLTSGGVGDLDLVFSKANIGEILVDPNSDEEISRAVKKLVATVDNPATKGNCRSLALEIFSLDSGVQSYHRAYLDLGV